MGEQVSAAELIAWRRAATGLAERGSDAAPDEPGAVVRRSLAVQAQDHLVALWSVGQRTARRSEADVSAAYDAGALVRTHVLRPTWHFVTPEDLGWLVSLTAPRVHRANGTIYRRHGLDEATRARAAQVIAGTLARGRSATRQALAEALAGAGMVYDGEALAHLCMHAELEQVVCSGPMQGRQHTYALWDERVPPTAPLHADDAVARLVRRYLIGHGPATVRDLAWWSSLTLTTVRRALANLADEIVALDVEGAAFVAVGGPPVAHLGRSRVDLIQALDEYIIGFSESRALVADPALPASVIGWENAVLVDGLVTGTWRRTLRASDVTVEVTSARTLTAAERAALAAEVSRLGAFLGLTPSLELENRSTSTA